MAVSRLFCSSDTAPGLKACLVNSDTYANSNNIPWELVVSRWV